MPPEPDAESGPADDAEAQPEAAEVTVAGAPALPKRAGRSRAQASGAARGPASRRPRRRKPRKHQVEVVAEAAPEAEPAPKPKRSRRPCKGCRGVEAATVVVAEAPAEERNRGPVRASPRPRLRRGRPKLRSRPYRNPLPRPRMYLRHQNPLLPPRPHPVMEGVCAN